MLELPNGIDLELAEEFVRANIKKLDLESATEELKVKNYARETNKIVNGQEDARVFNFYAPIVPETVSRCMYDVENWSRRFPGSDITIVFNSPGGSVSDGFALYDFLQDIRARGHKLITIGYGTVASMGAVLLQAGDHRIMGKNCFLMMHEVGIENLSGLTSQLDDWTKVQRRVEEKIVDVLTERASMSKGKIKNAIKRKEFWLDAQEALKYGFIDEIA